MVFYFYLKGIHPQAVCSFRDYMVKLPISQIQNKYLNESSLWSIWFTTTCKFQIDFQCPFTFWVQNWLPLDFKPLNSWESSTSVLHFVKSNHLSIIIISSSRSGNNTCITKTVWGLSSKSFLALCGVLYNF